MKATKAYIASLGTTGVLLGASLLMLAIVSAVVAFDRWPNGEVSTRVQTLVLPERAQPVRVGADAGASRASEAARAAAAIGAVGRTPAHVIVPGTTPDALQRVAGERTAGARPATPPSCSTVCLGPKQVEPPEFLPDPDTLDPGNPATLTGAAANTTQSASAAAGGTVGGDGGQAVSSTGAQAADAVRMLPLPGPGH